MPQLSYSYGTQKGVAGSLMDIAPYAIASRINGEANDSAMLFGMGAMVGAAPGKDVIVPTSAMTAAQFEGIILTGFTQQMDYAGDVKVYKGQTVGVLRYGNAWVRVPNGITPAYGEPLYLIVDGADAGKFTNDSAAPNIAIAGRFIDGLGTGDIAPVELFNQKQQ